MQCLAERKITLLSCDTSRSLSVSNSSPTMTIHQDGWILRPLPKSVCEMSLLDVTTQLSQSEVSLGKLFRSVISAIEWGCEEDRRRGPGKYRGFGPEEIAIPWLKTKGSLKNLGWFKNKLMAIISTRASPVEKCFPVEKRFLLFIVFHTCGKVGNSIFNEDMLFGGAPAGVSRPVW